MTQRYTPEWGNYEPIEILTKRVGFPAEVVGEFLLHPDDPHPGRSFVIIYPADSEEGQRQFETVLHAIIDADAEVIHQFESGFEDYARAALDALRGEA